MRDRRLERPWALVGASAPFALFGYLVISGTGSGVVQLAVLLVAGVLAFRAFGLKRATADVDTSRGHLRLETEFEVRESEDAD